MARGFAAARMLGAEAVQMGTAFVVAKESIVHENYKQRVIKARDIDSEVTGASTGHPIRVLRNKMTREYLKKEEEGASFEELGASDPRFPAQGSDGRRCRERKCHGRSDRGSDP